jgi:hypothetical protein
MGKRVLPNGSCKIKWHNHQHLQWICWQSATPAVAKAKMRAKEIQDLIDSQTEAKLERDFLFRNGFIKISMI